MAVVEMAEMKAELRVDFDDEDAVIAAKIDAAQSHLESLLGYKIEEEFPPEGEPPVSMVPADIVGAVKALAAGMYENRESVIVGASAVPTPHGVWEVVTNRRRYSFDGGD